MLRAFIAITPPVALQQAFAEVRASVERQAFPWRWVNPAQVHVTLKFLGDIEPALVDPIAQAMSRTVTGQAPFTLLARGIGCFPNLSRPRVLWMGLDDAQQILTQLHQRLEAELTPLGFVPEARPFRPHFTLARAQHGPGRSQLAPLLHAYRERQFGAVVVEQMQLLQSQLHRQGAIHTLLRSVTL
jgi:2'-5' RNA ligase